MKIWIKEIILTTGLVKGIQQRKRIVAAQNVAYRYEVRSGTDVKYAPLLKRLSNRPSDVSKKRRIEDNIVVSFFKGFPANTIAKALYLAK
jgi:hypothetical protein